MMRYYELISDCSAQQLIELKKNLAQQTLHPMEAKKRLAVEIVNRYHGAPLGDEERTRFENLFSSHTHVGIA